MSAEPGPARTGAANYIDHGWSLCAVRPRSKQAYGDRWQAKGRSVEHWARNPDDGMGLIHGLSGTCSLDLDDPENARVALAAVDVDLDALISDPAAVRLVGAPDRGKLVYRAPSELSRYALNWPDPETGKQRAVLELRAGAVMDVLPPSIHPDTGQPYRWEGNWRNLPPLPVSLLAVWERWTEAKRKMEAACPWQDRPDLSIDRYAHVERRRYSEGESVIAAFNDAHDPRSILESFGYRRAGPRLISPHSSSGTPGVVFLPGSEGRLVYVHHASDPLCDGHAHDAFSVWLQLEHFGDVRVGVRAAAEILGMDYVRKGSEEAREGAAIAARILTPAPPDPTTQLKDAPEEWSIPPIPNLALADLEYWLRRRHFGAKRIATTQGALAFAAAMTVRRYTTTDRQPLNVLLGLIDSSTAGLRPAIKGGLYEAADACGERAIIRGTKISSDASIHKALRRNPRMFWVADDYGHMVATARKQPSGALESALGCIQETYGGYPLYLDPDTFGEKKDVPLNQCTIYSPGLVALALVSEDQMREVTRRAEYGRGAVQQVLFARADDWPDEDAGKAPGATVPKSVVDRCNDLRTVQHRAQGGLTPGATQPALTATVEMGPGAADALEEVRAGLRLIFHDDELARWRGVAHGAFTTTRRLAAALGAWTDPEVPIMTADLVRWVGAWVTHHAAQSVTWYEAISSDDGEPDLIADVRTVLWKAGRDGLSAREIARHCRPFRRLPAEKREEVLVSMVNDRLCAVLAAGRTEKYVDRAYIATVPDPSENAPA